MTDTRSQTETMSPTARQYTELWENTLRPHIWQAMEDGRNPTAWLDAPWAEVAKILTQQDLNAGTIADIWETLLAWCRRAEQHKLYGQIRRRSVCDTVRNLIPHEKTRPEQIIDLYRGRWYEPHTLPTIPAARCLTAEHLQQIADEAGWDWQLAAHPAVTEEQLRQMVEAADASGDENKIFWTGQAVSEHPNSGAAELRWAFERLRYQAGIGDKAALHPNAPADVRIAWKLHVGLDKVRQQSWDDEQLRIAADLAENWTGSWQDLVAVIQGASR